MHHRLMAGHFEKEPAVTSRRLVIVTPLDLEVVYSVLNDCGLSADGHVFMVGKDELILHDEGYLDCPLLTAGTNKRAVDFMLRISDLTHCMFVELGQGEIVSDDVLRESMQE